MDSLGWNFPKSRYEIERMGSKGLTHFFLLCVFPTNLFPKLPLEDEKDSPPLQRTGPEGGRLSKEKLTWPWWWSETFTGIILIIIIIMITITMLLVIMIIIIIILLIILLIIIITTIIMVRIMLKSNLLRRLTVGQTAKWILFLTQSLKNYHYHWEK